MTVRKHCAGAKEGGKDGVCGDCRRYRRCNERDRASKTACENYEGRKKE